MKLLIFSMKLHLEADRRSANGAVARVRAGPLLPERCHEGICQCYKFHPPDQLREGPSCCSSPEVSTLS